MATKAVSKHLLTKLFLCLSHLRLFALPAVTKHCHFTVAKKSHQVSLILLFPPRNVFQYCAVVSCTKTRAIGSMSCLK